MRLCELRRVKDMLGMSPADTIWNETLGGMIEAASLEAEHITIRKFLRVERTEFFESQDRGYYDPRAQYLRVSAWPIDTGQTFILKWAPYGLHDDYPALTLTEDYTIDDVNGWVLVRAIRGQAAISTLPIPAGSSFPFTTADPRGFKLIYTGGSPEFIPSPDPPKDPLDELRWVQVDNSLQQIVASKVADDFEKQESSTVKRYRPWSNVQKDALMPYMARKLI